MSLPMLTSWASPSSLASSNNLSASSHAITQNLGLDTVAKGWVAHINDAPKRYASVPITAASGCSSTYTIGESQAMIALSQSASPGNICGSGSRGSSDLYGFLATHSTSSSISLTGGSPLYFSGSVDSSVSNYTNTGSDIESALSRSLQRQLGLLNRRDPPAPQSMMSQFSSKVSSHTQKKHKCKVCEKRFARPSSCQTHMYSHTGEKPFLCEVEGCGRRFSVVSNLRRHRKIHKGEARSR
ncbi:hypothetical protein B0J14DRAFT_554677 [Halenospora varia]|nr:hypothetical protein B0J14DRAFT_554677 [Halenospora varia]